MLDRFHRKIEYVRISVTDRCNLRCRYCMPEHGIEKLPHEAILSFEEIIRAVRVFASLGFRKIRLTGGEPLVRPGITGLIREIKGIAGIEKVALTTNGVLLGSMAEELVDAGIDGVNLSIDTLDDQVFSDLTRRPLLNRVREGLEKLVDAGCRDIKLNCVPIYGVNEEDIVHLAGLARKYPFKVRFIELMPIGCAFAAGYKGIPMDEVKAVLRNAYGPLLFVNGKSDALQGPAEYADIPGFIGQVGFIDAIEHKFCSSCNRVRLTAEGFLKLCLNSRSGLDVRHMLRSGCSDEELQWAVSRAVYGKPKEHSFLQNSEDELRDTRLMYQVGG